MLSKVESSLALIERLPGLEVRIFSGEEPGDVQRALSGDTVGTRIRGSTL
jgi:isopentenyl phosphate kinase